MSMRILVVDDTKFMRMMLSDILVKFGYTVVGEVENGKLAIKKYKEFEPDLIMMDITMPEMDGVDAMKEIHKINPEVPVVICSANSQESLISEALKAGAIDYVMKPFEPNAVKEIIEKTIVQLDKKKALQAEELRLQKEKEEEEASILRELQAAEKMELQTMKETASAKLMELTEVILENNLVQFSQQKKESSENETIIAVLDEPISMASFEVNSEELELLLFNSETNDKLEDSLEPLLLEQLPKEDLNKQEFSIKEILSQLKPFPSGHSLFEENKDKLDVSELQNDLHPVLPLEPQEPVDADVIQVSTQKINGNRGGNTMKKLTTSYMCNWNEEIDKKEIQFTVQINHGEKKLSLTAVNGDETKSISLSVDAIRQLTEWLEDKSPYSQEDESQPT